MDSISLETQAHPARADRIVLSRRDNLTFVGKTGVRNPADDGEVSLWAGAAVRSNCDGIGFDYLAIVHERKLPVGNADQDEARKRDLLAFLFFGGRCRCDRS